MANEVVPASRSLPSSASSASSAFSRCARDFSASCSRRTRRGAVCVAHGVRHRERLIFQRRRQVGPRACAVSQYRVLTSTSSAGQPRLMAISTNLNASVSCPRQHDERRGHLHGAARMRRRKTEFRLESLARVVQPAHRHEHRLRVTRVHASRFVVQCKRASELLLGRYPLATVRCDAAERRVRAGMIGNRARARAGPRPRRGSVRWRAGNRCPGTAR